jgi:hypothetical protein
MRHVLASTLNIINYTSRIVDASRSVNDDSRVMLQIVASLTIIIYNCNIFIVQATSFNFFFR